MAAVRPKLVCGQCGSTLTRSDKLCPACGAAVDWSRDEFGGESISRKEERANGKFRYQGKTLVWSSKSFYIAMAVIAGAVVIYAVMLEKRPGPAAAQKTNQPPSASMQMPPAILELENSVAANPDDMSLTLQLANALQDGLFYEKAIPYYKAYLTMNPADANARVDMGICYKELGNYTEAESAMKAALHYAPKHLNAHFNLGIVYLNEGNIKEADIWFKRTVALDPTGDAGKRAQQLLIQHNTP